MAKKSLTIRIPVKVKRKIDGAVRWLNIVASRSEDKGMASRSSFMIDSARELAKEILYKPEPTETRMPGKWAITGPLKRVGSKKMVSISLTINFTSMLQAAAIKHGDTITGFVLRSTSLRASKLLHTASRELGDVEYRKQVLPIRKKRRRRRIKKVIRP